MAVWEELPLTSDHAGYLASSAITPAVASAIGVFSATAVEELPSEFRHYGDAVLPALVFPWTEPNGSVKHQIKPEVPVKNADGQYAKYLFGKSNHAQLVKSREANDALNVMIVEGSKQCLAAASYAPPGVSVYGILGCRGWSKDGVPTPDLYVVEDKETYICLDGDVSSNLDVYNAALALAEACKMHGATSVKFVRLAAGRKAGLDDVLGAQTPDRRANMLVRMLENAHRKPADTKPKPKKSASRPVPREDDDDRPTIAVNGDRFVVINDLTNALIGRWDGHTLFNYGGAISRVTGHKVQPLEDGAFLDIVAATAVTVSRSEDQEGNVKEVPGWPDGNSLRATASRAERFTELVQVQRAPFVRRDGSICTVPGYDRDSRTLLVLDAGLEGLEIPEEPTRTQLGDALDFIRAEWLGDFPFPTPADKANALALILTPLVRGLADVVPVAVVNGLQMGVGKNKFANCVSLVATGQTATPLGYNQDNEEQRKVMTSVFRTGQTLFVWDECHVLTGEHFARAVTSHTYSDRILGGSVMAEYPNVATWVTLGNGVQVQNDMARRVYEIAMRTDRPNPQDRRSSEFRHPDIEGWTAQNRAEILAALLTLVRAWFVQGCPGPEGGTSFGSFERWEKVIGGIFRVSGVPGFLGNMKEFRSDSDFNRAMWQLHLEGLADFFGGREFTTKEVQEWLARNEHAEAPPGFLDPSIVGFARNLGMAYQRQRERWYGSVRLVRAEGTGHGKVAKWSIMTEETTPGGTGGTGGSPLQPPRENTFCVSCNCYLTVGETHVCSSRIGGVDSPRSPHSLPGQRKPSPDESVTVHSPVEGPVEEPLDNQLDQLMDLAYVPSDDELRCWECGGVKRSLPPSGIGYACPGCHPAMFARP